MKQTIEKRVSPYNLAGIGPSLPGSVMICDVTLRDGEQTAGVCFSLEEKMELIRLLDEIGVGQIQLAHVDSPDDYAVAKAACALRREKAKIEVMSSTFSRTWQTDIQGAVDVGADVVHSLVPLSPYMRFMYPEKPDDAMLFGRVEEVIAFMRDRGAPCVNISLLDATRVEEPLLRRMIELLLREGVDRIRFADTVGTCTPLGVYHVARFIKGLIAKHAGKKPMLGVHLHDDFGLATANALAAVVGGADFLDLSVNGLGERSGNPDLAQVTVALEVLGGVDTGIRIDKLYDLSRRVEALSGIPIPTNKPLIGALTFADESDSHVLATSEDPFAYQGILAETVGNHRSLIVGKKNGVNAVRLKMEQLGLPPAAPEKLPLILEDIRSENLKYRGTIMPDEAFIEIVKRHA